MLRFFRSIRQSLINENKTAKYLKYAAGEILLIIIGILIALNINTWNQNRLLRIEEREVVGRILEDLDKDIDHFSRRVEVLKKKKESLKSLKTQFASGKMTDVQSLLDDIISGSAFGWSHAAARRTTYDEMLGSGKLGLIRSPRARTAISAYYDLHLQQHRRIDERRTEYPDLSYVYTPSEYREARETGKAFSLNDEDAEELIAKILNSPIRDHINAELNYALFTEERSLEVQDAVLELKETLLSYHNEIQE